MEGGAEGDGLVAGRCNYGRAAVESARAGLRHVQSVQPHEYLALFLALGLLGNTRGIWHAIDNRDSKDPSLRPTITKWRAKRSDEIDRFRLVLVAARDALLKEWVTPMVSTGSAGYQLSIQIPRSDLIDGVLSHEEQDEREWAARFVEAMGGDGEHTRRSVRVHILKECSRAIELLEREIDQIEAMARSAGS